MKLIHLLLMGMVISTSSFAHHLPIPRAENQSPQHMRFNDLATRCSQGVHPNTLQAIARVESGFNPYAIGVVRGSLPRQPRNLDEAVHAARMLHAQGKNFSMGLMQINRYNLNAYGLNYETVFDPCKNIHAGAQILKACFDRAGGNGQQALQKAFSCYYSGNFRFGFRSDFKGQPPYVTKVMMSAMHNSPNQAIRSASGSLNSHSRQAALMRTSYVPEPNPHNRQPAPSAMPNPVSVEEEHTAKPPEAPSQASKPKQEWDIFQEF